MFVLWILYTINPAEEGESFQTGNKKRIAIITFRVTKEGNSIVVTTDVHYSLDFTVKTTAAVNLSNSYTVGTVKPDLIPCCRLMHPRCQLLFTLTLLCCVQRSLCLSFPYSP